MRLFNACALCLLLAAVALAQQGRPVLESKGRFNVVGPGGETVLWHKFLERENKLELIGRRTVSLLDVETGKLSEPRATGLEGLNPWAGVDPNEWVLSPDGRRMLVVNHPQARDGKKRLGMVWDLEAGRRVALLDAGAYDVRSGYWSENGRTLVTFEKQWPGSVTVLKFAVSFWDGRTFAHLFTLPIENVTWWKLSDDGEKFFAATGSARSLLGVKYVTDEEGGEIKVWDVRTGRLEKTIPVSDDEFMSRTSKIEVSPDGKFLAYGRKHKADPAQSKVLVWQLDGALTPKYELRATPTLGNSRVGFSPDSKYLAVDVGRNLRIYETATGALKHEVPGRGIPEEWADGNRVLLYTDFDAQFFSADKKLEGYSVADGRRIFNLKLVHVVVEKCDSTYITPDSQNCSDYETVDDTTVRVSPDGRMFLTYSKQYVKVFDSRTGELLQTLVSPPVDYSQKKPKVNYRPQVWRAGWSADGKTVYAINYERDTVSLWGVTRS